MGVDANLNVAKSAICLTVCYVCGILFAMSDSSGKQELDPKREYSVTETAVFVGVSRRHVRRLTDAGYLEGYRLSPAPGSTRRIYGHSIIAFLEARKNQN